MATEVFNKLKRWVRYRGDVVPQLEVTAKGILVPGVLTGAWEFRDDFNTFTASASGVTSWHVDRVL